MAVAVAALLVSGTTSYLLAASHGRSAVSQSCDIHQCIPRLKAATVVTALKERGYTCSTSYNHEQCQLHVGAFYFDATLQVSEDLITDISLRVFRQPSTPLTPGSVAFLKWFGVLPYRDDPVLAGQIEAWLDTQIEATRNAKAIIGDYEYTLTNEGTNDVLLRIKGTYQ